jgi:hypothetical protein
MAGPWTVDRGPKTATVAQFLKVADTPVEINNQLTALEADLKRLEAEYNMYFSGRLPRPPWETRQRVQATVKRLDQTHITNYGIRFRFTTLQTRLSRFIDLWDRALRAREEGRPGPLSHLAPQAEQPAATAETRVEDRILRVATFSNPSKEPVKVRELYNSFIEARKQAGQERVDYERFEQLVNAQVRAIQAKGAAEVAFRVAIQDGKVAFTARAMRGADDE